MIGDVTLGAPLALAGLAVVPLLLAAWWYAARRRRAADRAYGGPPGLRRGVSRTRRGLRGLLLLAAVVLVVLAAARPRWGSEQAPLSRQGIDIAVALDVSRSMTATDVQPSRAEAAANGLRDMLRHLRGDRVGLVTFGGSAFARSPLTLDYAAFGDLVNRAQREQALVRPGTDIGEALNVALQVLEVDDPADTQVIVLISDGEDLGQDVEGALSRLRDRGIRVYAVAAGTEQGAPVPAGEGRRPAAGAPVVSRADRTTLQRIATETGGELREVASIAGLAVEFAGLRQSELAEGEGDVPIERFQWFLGAALALLLLQSLIPDARRAAPLRVGRIGALGAASLLALVLGACSGTALYRHVERGNEAHEAGRYEDALAAYEEAAAVRAGHPPVDYNLGNTLHQLQRYEEAGAASAAAAANTEDAALAARARYAVGNSAFRRQALEEARDAYIDVLLRDPADQDARHNLEVVLRILNPPPPPAQNPPGQQPTQPSGTPPAGATPGASGTAAPGAGATGTPDAGMPQQPGSQPQPGATDPRQTPGATTPPGPVTPGTPGPSGGEAAPLDPAEARRLLEEALRALGDDVTLEEALAVLERARRASEADSLGPRGGTADPNDR